MDLPPTLSDPEWTSTVFSGFEWEGGGSSWHWALRAQLLPGSLPVSYLLGDYPLAGGAEDTEDESMGGLCQRLGGRGERLGGASFHSGWLGCAPQKQEALMGALVTGLM